MTSNGLKTKTLIGLEIHVQLATRTKMFCGCELAFGAEPNSRVCPVCLGMPGSLPVINRQAYEYAVKVGLALNCTIAARTKWDRKSYYYPDLPKNYQISQYDMPLAEHGYFDIPVDGRTRRIRIRRAHLEEDAGKNLHEKPGFSQVDLNRAGTPLLEIVTEPDLTSADEAYVFCTELQRLVTYLGVSEAVMQKGQMRFEPNVNVVITYNGQEIPTPIVEVKNLNSFRAVRNAIAYEVERQIQEWQADPTYTLARQGKENRGWNDDRGITEFQRGKEEAHDYRYFPDPDLVPVETDAKWLEGVRATMTELPLSRQARFVSEYGLSVKDTETLLGDRQTADLYEAAIRAGGDPALLGKHFTNFWLTHANARGTTVAGLGIDAARMAELARLVADGQISATSCVQIAEAVLNTGKSPSQLADEMNLRQVQDAGRMQAWVDEAFAANEQAVRDALTNPKKAKAAPGFLQGQVMKISKGQADPKIVRDLIQKKLNELGAV
jgi:aspartyl-tRNA(Asn)/glutamyl-tRNA(Gln) amidotransferase subunit B